MWWKASFNDRTARQSARLGKEVERDRAGVGIGIEREGVGRRTGRYVGCMTHLQPMELIAVAEDVGSDEGKRVGEICVVGVEVVASWSRCELTAVFLGLRTMMVKSGSTYNGLFLYRSLSLRFHA